MTLSSSFLWTEAVLRELRARRSQDQIRKLLDSVPNTIEAMYGQALRKILPQDLWIAESILELLLCAGGQTSMDLATDYPGLSSRQHRCACTTVFS
jgi:hypothetical protein